MKKKEACYLLGLVFLLYGLSACSTAKCGMTARQDCIGKSSNYSALLNCFDKMSGGAEDHIGKEINGETGYPTTLSR